MFIPAPEKKNGGTRVSEQVAGEKSQKKNHHPQRSHRFLSRPNKKQKWRDERDDRWMERRITFTPGGSQTEMAKSSPVSLWVQTQISLSPCWLIHFIVGLVTFLITLTEMSQKNLLGQEQEDEDQEEDQEEDLREGQTIKGREQKVRRGHKEEEKQRRQRENLENTHLQPFVLFRDKI
jgi:hypothetical protein